jgi:5-methylcytosine-specific restriction endonuclease McrA
VQPGKGQAPEMNAFSHVPRKALTDRERAKLIADSRQLCAHCQRRIRAGQVWHADHIQALETGGTNDIENFQVLCVNCHSMKTSADHAKAAKIRSVAIKHLVPGVARQRTGRPMAGTRASGWKKPFQGPATRR